MTRTGFQIAAIDTVAAILAPMLLVNRPRRPAAYVASVAVGGVGFLVLAAIELLIRALVEPA